MKKLACLALVLVSLLVAGCHASGGADNHKGDVKVEGNK